MPRYEQAGFTYEQAGVPYESTLIAFVSLAGDQPFATGTIARLGAPYLRTLTGDQPAISPGTYESPSITYEQFAVLYESPSDPGHLSWRGTYHRLLAGDQPFPTGNGSWKWHPYIFAEYTWTIGSVPESTVYAMSVTADDQVQYEHTDSHDDARTEAEYSHLPIEPHTRDTL